MELKDQQDKEAPEAAATKDAQPKPLVRFGQTTSIKGISRAVRTPANPVRGMWLIAGAMGISLGMTQILNIITQYISYDVVTKMSMKYGEVPLFPDISICNLNPLNLNLGLGNNTSEVFEEFIQDTWEIYEALPKPVNEKLWDEVISLSGFLRNVDYGRLPKDQDDWHPITNGMIVDCSLFGWEWSELQEDNNCMDRIQAIYNPEYFACNTISLNDVLRREGKVRGLSVIVFINDIAKIFMPLFQLSLVQAKGKGARVQVHAPNTLPDFKTGASIAPGTESTFHLKGFENKLLGDPYGDCLPIRTFSQVNTEFMQEDYADALMDKTYTTNVCMDLCRQEWVIDECGCIGFHLLATEEMFDNHTFCGTLQRTKCLDVPVEETVECFKNDYQLKKTAFDLNCSLHEFDPRDTCGKLCRPPCEEYKYDFEITHTVWPHESYHLAFFEEYISGMGYSTRPFDEVYEPLVNLKEDDPIAAYDELLKVDLISRNYLQLNFFFGEKVTIIRQEAATVTFSTMFANIGGLLNLWAGITFYTMFEFLELGYYLLRDVVAKKCGKTTKVQAF